MITDQDGGALFDAITTETAAAIKGIMLIPEMVTTPAQRQDLLHAALALCDTRLKRIIQDFVISQNTKITQTP
jgi:hypothetical protein